MREEISIQKEGVLNTTDKALRYDKEKLRYDLLEPHALEKLVEVYTKGAAKYEPWNYLKGMKWSRVIASLKRHIAAFERGEDIDPDPSMQTYHMANAAWNCMTLLSYYKYYPQGDDRLHQVWPKKRISIDVDDCLSDFVGEWCKMYNIKEATEWNFDDNLYERIEKMKKSGTYEHFLLQLPSLIKPEDIPFQPVAYVTARCDENKSITEEWLKLKGFPNAPVYCTNHSSKVEILKELKVDIHVDDSYPNYLEINRAGLCCFLLDANHNRKHEVGYRRLYSLKELV